MSDLVKLKRVVGDNDRTFGVLSIKGLPLCVTIERPWLDNTVGKSCIPAGKYRVARTDSHHFGSTWQVKDVPGRSHILIHKGNTANDTEGCIIVGQRFGILNNEPAVLASGAAYSMLESILPDEFTLEVSV